MALHVEGVEDSGVKRQEALGSSGRFEALHLALAPSCRLVRILSPIVLAQAPLVASRQSDFGLCRAVRAQLVVTSTSGAKSLFLDSFASVSRLRPYRAVVARADREPRLHRQPRAAARTACPQSSRPGEWRGEFRPGALSEPDMILSYHPAHIVRPLP